MSTSFLYHGWGVRGYYLVGQEFAAGRIVHVIAQEDWRLRCPACGSARVIRSGQFEREFRTVPIGRQAVFIRLPIQRVECLECGVIRQVKVGFADARRSYTRSFERLALNLCEVMTLQDVARYLEVSWGTIKDRKCTVNHTGRASGGNGDWFRIAESSVRDGEPAVRQQFGQAGDGVGGDAGQYVTQIGEGIDLMPLAGGDEAKEGGGGPAALVRTAKEPVLASQRHPPQGVFSRVIVDGQVTVGGVHA
jgi:hypothetical protein